MTFDGLPYSNLRPVVFGDLAGMLHVPLARAGRGLTIVICPPVGRDYIWTYRALFMWAERLAAAGMQVLRFDNRGHGDSQSLDPDDDQWRHWLDGIISAYRFARADLGTSKQRAAP